jgi:hypothetical protein
MIAVNLPRRIGGTGALLSAREEHGAAGKILYSAEPKNWMNDTGPALDRVRSRSPEAPSGGFDSRRLQAEQPSTLKRGCPAPRRSVPSGRRVDRSARAACKLRLFPAGANTRRRCVSRGWVMLWCMVLAGCSGTAPSVREAPEQPQRCVYVPHRDGAAEAHKEAVEAQRVGMRVVLVAAPVGAAPVEPLAPRAAPPLEGLSGEGLGDGVPRGVLRLVPESGLSVEVGAGGAAGEVLVVGGAVVAAVGSGLLVCLTASAVADGEKTPIAIADRYYGTHFGDVKGWVQVNTRPRLLRPQRPSSSPARVTRNDWGASMSPTGSSTGQPAATTRGGPAWSSTSPSPSNFKR